MPFGKIARLGVEQAARFIEYAQRSLSRFRQVEADGGLLTNGLGWFWYNSNPTPVTSRKTLLVVEAESDIHACLFIAGIEIC